MRRKCEVGLEETFELQQRFFIKNNEVQVLGLNPSLTQTVIHSLFWKIEVVLLSRETLLLGCRDDFSVHYQRCRAIMIKSGKAENEGRHKLAGLSIRRRLSRFYRRFQKWKRILSSQGFVPCLWRPCSACTCSLVSTGNTKVRNCVGRRYCWATCWSLSSWVPSSSCLAKCTSGSATIRPTLSHSRRL